MKNKTTLLISTSLTFVLILFLTGCLDKKEKTNNETLVKSSESSIAKFEDFKDMISILEKNETGLQFIPLLPEEEQEKIYLKLIEEYIVYNYLIKKYLEENKISTADDFKNEKKQYMELMENNYNASAFQKNLSDSIVLTDEFAENYYLSNREKAAEFMVAPFAKKIPGIEARAVRMEDNTKLDDYKDRLKNNKDVINLDRVNESMRGSSKILLDNLKEMKNNDFREIKIENGMKFAILKLSENKGEWATYKELSEKIKNIIKTKILQEKYETTINSLKDKYAIEINKDLVKDFIKKSVKKEEPSEKELEEAVEKISESIASEKAQEIEEDLKEEFKKEIKDEIKDIAEITNE